MARGGARPGAGRPKGAGKGSSVKATAEQAVKAAKKLRLSPLEYMLSVMNDAEADPARRDRMAQAAAPFVHPKAEAPKTSKADELANKSRTAEDGTSWAGLLQ